MIIKVMKNTDCQQLTTIEVTDFVIKRIIDFT